MKPYYEHGGVTIYLGDCLDVLPQLPTARLAFSDPPYNSGLKYGAGTNDQRDDYWEWLGERIAAMRAVGEAVVVKHSALKLPEFVSRFPGRVLVWHKTFSSGFPLHGIATHWEPLHLLQGKSARWTQDVFACSTGNHRDPGTGHPAQFPERLARWVVETFTSPGDLLIDSCTGSGTMLVAAKQLGRRAIGIEIEERYCAIAAQRLQQEVMSFEEPMIKSEYEVARWQGSLLGEGLEI